MTDTQEPFKDEMEHALDSATAEVNEDTAAFLDAVLGFVKPVLATLSMRIITAYLRGQIGHGVVELQACDEVGVRIGGEGRSESMGSNERGELCVFHQGRDLCLTVGGSLVLVTYDNDGTDDARIAEARVLSSLEVVAMFGADAVYKMVVEIVKVVEGLAGGRSIALRWAAREGLKRAGYRVSPLLTAMLPRNIPAQTESAASADVDDVP